MGHDGGMADGPEHHTEQPTSEDLERIPLLTSLDAHAKERLARRLEVVEYARDERIIIEGTSGADLYIIESGRATATQRERGLLRTLRPGDFFGEIALLEKRGQRTATVTASTPMVVWVLRGNAIRSLQAEFPEVTKALVTAMGDRLATDW